MSTYRDRDWLWVCGDEGGGAPQWPLEGVEHFGNVRPHVWRPDLPFAGASRPTGKHGVAARLRHRKTLFQYCPQQKYFMSTLLCDYKKKFKLFTLVELEEPVKLVRMFAGFKVEIDNTGVDQEGWVVVVPEKNKERSKW